jgi:hypothetical protein
MAPGQQRISNNSGSLADCRFFPFFNSFFSIKNQCRTSSSQENLNSFMVLCSESDVLEVINTDDLMKGFAS